MPERGLQKPVEQFIEHVLLPAPFSPTSANTSPARISRLTSSLAVTPGTAIVMCSKRTMGAAFIHGIHPLQPLHTSIHSTAARRGQFLRVSRTRCGRRPRRDRRYRNASAKRPGTRARPPRRGTRRPPAGPASSPPRRGEHGGLAVEESLVFGVVDLRVARGHDEHGALAVRKERVLASGRVGSPRSRRPARPWRCCPQRP